MKTHPPYIALFLLFTANLYGGEVTIQTIGDEIAKIENTGGKFIESNVVFADGQFALKVYKAIKDRLPESDRNIPDAEIVESVNNDINGRKVVYAVLLKSVGKKIRNEYIEKLGPVKFIGGTFVPITKYFTANGDGQGIAVMSFTCVPKEGVEVIFVLTPECVKVGGEYRLGEMSPNAVNVIK